MSQKGTFGMGVQAQMLNPIQNVSTSTFMYLSSTLGFVSTVVFTTSVSKGLINPTNSWSGTVSLATTSANPPFVNTLYVNAFTTAIDSYNLYVFGKSGSIVQQTTVEINVFTGVPYGVGLSLSDPFNSNVPVNSIAMSNNVGTHTFSLKVFPTGLHQFPSTASSTISVYVPNYPGTVTQTGLSILNVYGVFNGAAASQTPTATVNTSSTTVNTPSYVTVLFTGSAPNTGILNVPINATIKDSAFGAVTGQSEITFVITGTPSAITNESFNNLTVNYSLYVGNTETVEGLATFGNGITGTGNTGTLAAGSGILGAANTWTGTQTFDTFVLGGGLNSTTPTVNGGSYSSTNFSGSFSDPAIEMLTHVQLDKALIFQQYQTNSDPIFMQRNNNISNVSIFELIIGDDASGTKISAPTTGTTDYFGIGSTNLGGYSHLFGTDGSAQFAASLIVFGTITASAKAEMGQGGNGSNYATWASSDYFSNAYDYALLQGGSGAGSDAGRTFLNSSVDVRIRILNNDIAQIYSSAFLAIQTLQYLAQTGSAISMGNDTTHIGTATSQTASPVMYFYGTGYTNTTGTLGLIDWSIQSLMEGGSSTNPSAPNLYFQTNQPDWVKYSQITIVNNNATTSSQTTENSPNLGLRAHYWNGTNDATEEFDIRTVMDSTSPTFHLSFQASGTEIFRINQSGAITLGIWEGSSISNTYLTGPLISSLITESGGGITLTATNPGAIGSGYYTPSVTIGGDISGTSLSALTVAKLQTYTLTITSPANNQTLVYNGTAWVNSLITAVNSLNGLTGALTLTSPNSTLNIGTSGSDVTLDINLAHANTWSATQTFDGSANSNIQLQISTPSGSTANGAFINYMSGVSGTTATWYIGLLNTSLSGATQNDFVVNLGGVGNVLRVGNGKGLYSFLNTLDDGSGNMYIAQGANFAVSASNNILRLSDKANTVLNPVTGSGSVYLNWDSGQGTYFGNGGTTIIAHIDNSGNLSIAGSLILSKGLQASESTGYNMYISSSTLTETAYPLLLNNNRASGIAIYTDSPAVTSTQYLMVGGDNPLPYGYSMYSSAGSDLGGMMLLRTGTGDGGTHLAFYIGNTAPNHFYWYYAYYGTQNTITGNYINIGSPIMDLDADANILTLSGTFNLSGLATFGNGITGTGNTGTLTAGSGILGAANTWTAQQTFDATVIGNFFGSSSGPKATFGANSSYYYFFGNSADLSWGFEGVGSGGDTSLTNITTYATLVKGIVNTSIGRKLGLYEAGTNTFAGFVGSSSSWNFVTPYNILDDGSGNMTITGTGTVIQNMFHNQLVTDVQTSAASTASENLSGYWPFDEDTLTYGNDWSGNANTATMEGTGGGWGTGYYGSAFVTNGSSYMQLNALPISSTGGGGGSGSGAVFAGPIIPYYVSYPWDPTKYPDTSLSSVIPSGNTVPIIVIWNPDNGSGAMFTSGAPTLSTSQQATFRSNVAYLHNLNLNIKIVGYVATAWCCRPYSSISTYIDYAFCDDENTYGGITQNIDGYYRICPELDGIFFDEGISNGSVTSVLFSCAAIPGPETQQIGYPGDTAAQYGTKITSYVHAKKANTVSIFNPGSTVNTAFLGVFDIINSFENSETTMLTPSQVANVTISAASYPAGSNSAGSWSVLEYFLSNPGQSAMISNFVSVVTYCTHVYLDDVNVGGNPWAGLSSYLSTELTAFSSSYINTGGGGGGSASANFTVTARIKTNGASVNGQGYVLCSAGGLTLTLDNGSNQIYLLSTSSNPGIGISPSGTNLADGNWHFVAFNLNNGAGINQIAACVDGSTTTATYSYCPIISGNFEIGASSTLGLYNPITIDDFRTFTISIGTSEMDVLNGNYEYTTPNRMRFQGWPYANGTSYTFLDYEGDGIQFYNESSHQIYFKIDGLGNLTITGKITSQTSLQNTFTNIIINPVQAGSVFVVNPAPGGTSSFSIFNTSPTLSELLNNAALSWDSNGTMYLDASSGNAMQLNTINKNTIYVPYSTINSRNNAWLTPFGGFSTTGSAQTTSVNNFMTFCIGNNYPGGSFNPSVALALACNVPGGNIKYPTSGSSNATVYNLWYSTVLGSSDIKFKTNIYDADWNYRDIIDHMHLHFFNRMDDYHMVNNEREIGLIAQEVQKICPEIIGGTEETSLGISQMELIAVTIGAIQQLSKKIYELESHTLKGRLKHLYNRIFKRNATHGI